LALVLMAQNEQGETLRNVSLEAALNRHAWAKEKAAHAQGFSLQELASLGKGEPVTLDLAALRTAARPGHPVLVHLRAPTEPKCFTVFEQPQRKEAASLSGHFVVVEMVTEAYVELLDPDAGRVRWPLNHFVYRWSGAALRLAGQTVPGQTVPVKQAQSLRGGCCGSPPPDPGDECGEDGGGGGMGGISATPPCRTCGGADGSGGGGCCPEEEGEEPPQEPPVLASPFGSPIYRFGLSSANLSLKDIPLWSTDAKGMGMNLQLIFNRVATQRMATNAGANYYAFGNKWHCNFFSHFTETPDGSGDIVLPGGRVQKFLQNPDGSYVAADVWNRNSLARTNNFFVLTFKQSGNKWHFNTNTALGQRLEKVEDQYGNAMTYSYHPVSGRLTGVTDAIGRSFLFLYSGQGYVTNVSDSFGRSASFTYQNGDLTSLTDMGGLTTLIQYDTNHWPTNIIYPSGQAWRLAYQYGQDALYAGYAEPFRAVVADPLGQTNEYFYHSFDYMGPITLRDKLGNNWLYAARTIGESGSGAQRIYYQGVNATIRPYTGTSDEWVHRTFDADANPIEVASVSQPLSVSVGYNDNEGVRAIDVLTTNLYDGRHNLLSSTILTNASGDPYSPDLRVVGTWTNWYDARDNLLGTRNPRNQTTRYGYDAKDHLTAVTNALSQVTRMDYDHNGNMTNLVDALLRTNRWTYNAQGRNFETIYADNLRLSQGYDPIGRLNALTNHGSGLYLSFFYDNMDRLRDVRFPDGTSNHFEYACCGLEWTRDRLNRITHYGRDALGRTTQVTDPENRVTQLQYNGADQTTNLITFVDGQARQKQFTYNATNGSSRLTQVTTPMGKVIRYDYTFRGGLAWRQDGNGKITKSQYDPLERLLAVTDENDVALVRMDYDVLGNMTYVSNAHSVCQYVYDGLNRATQALCRLKDIPGCATVNYKIDYAFDVVGNVTNRLITGLQGFTDTIRTSYSYDVVNRLTNVVQLTNGVTSASAWYAYDAAGRLWRKGYGNGDVVTHAYDAESRLLSLGITNGATMVTRYNYQWDSGGNILAITNNGTNITLYGYDRVEQLTNEICFTNGLAGRTTNAWIYDEAGNWLNANPTSRWRYNTDNELVARAATNDTTWNVTVTGEVEAGSNSNKWYNTWASSRGVSARVSTNDGTFILLDVPLNAGTNELVVTVTDISGNQSQQTRHVKKNALEIFQYDGNGNLTNWVNGSQNWTYQWDWSDRLTKVASNGVTVLENWYDVGSHRIGKAELIGSSMVRFVYLFDDWGIVGISSGGSGLYETYTRGVALVGDIGGLVGVARHAFNQCYYVHNNHRGDITHARINAQTLATYRYTAFGEMIGTTEGPSRFNFSSKERDNSTGLYYYGYRFYAPQWQRWMSADPGGDRGGANWFGFALNAAVSYVDPDGMAAAKPRTKKDPPPKPKKKCPTCEDLMARLNKVQGEEERAGDNNWVTDCYTLCDHLCAEMGNNRAAVRKCYDGCEKGKLPGWGVILTPPDTKRGR
jgi:RHS repeat-associated protein